ncbi:MAG: tetratricopeptide repeat protein [Deltaproteobacteria bacterium]|nr:tetratricopeptide repeat protein [Deltaproteobacteria bacterium]
MKIVKVLDYKIPVLLMLAVLVAAAYLNSLYNPFMWDDKVQVLDNPNIRGGWENVINAFSPRLWGLWTENEAIKSFYRPTHTLLSLLDYRVWGLDPFGFHLTNTVVHYGVTALLYLFALRLTADTAASFFAAAIFAVHPAHTESVSFIAARPDLLCAVFLLLSFHLYAFAGGAQRVEAEGRAGLLKWRYILSLVFFVLSLLSKEMSVVLPVFLLFHALAWGKWRLSRRGLAVLPFFVVLALYAAFRVFGVSIFVEQHRLRADTLTLGYTAAVAVFDYIRLLFFPYPLKAYYSIVWYNGLSARVVLALALLGASALSFLWLLVTKRKAAAFMLFWTYFSLAPVLNIGSLGEFSMAERYLYIPSIGFSVLFAMAFASYVRRRGISARKAGIAAALILAVLTLLTVKRNRVWGDDMTFFTAMVKGAPDSAVPHANLAQAYFSAGDMERAANELETAIGISGPNPRLYYELGYVYGRLGRLTEAVRELEKAISLDPRFEDAYIALGVAHGSLGNYAAAADPFRSALLLNPASERAASYLEKAERFLDDGGED